MSEEVEAIYEARLTERRTSLAEEERREARLANARLLIFVAGLLVAYFSLVRGVIPRSSLIVPIALFALTAVLHDKTLRRLALRRRAISFYERGLDRLAHRFAGRGSSGERFADPDHPYAPDLDLFGAGSVFELLCTARTGPGEETLAAWLLTPAAAETLRARHGAVAELREKLQLREELDLAGEAVRAGVSPAALVTWGEGARVLPGERWRAALLLLLAGNVFAVTAWALGAGPLPLVVTLALTWGAGRLLRSDVAEVSGAVDRPSRELELLAALLARLEEEDVRDPLLAQLRAEVKGSASHAIRSLSRLVGLRELPRNQLFAPLGFLLLWSPLVAFSIERWRARHGPRLRAWLRTVGEFEALASLASYAFEHPADPFPELVSGAPRYEGVELAHPLLPGCVPNTVHLKEAPQALLVSGSNMSGKSTLLRTVGINAVLALAGAPVHARSLRLTPLQVGATLRIQDSLQKGASRFYAEITRLRLVVELSTRELPVLFLLDEILHGTNSHDRGIGAEGILRGLLARGAVGLVTTHDLALARAAEALAPRAANVHFEDTLVSGELTFDYRLKAGVVERSNALELMRAVGLDV